jgi:hypothetical protein
MVEVKQMSNDRLQRKKYVVVWRWVSELMVRIMSRFPSTVTRYMDRNSPERMGCTSGSSERPIRRNCDPLVQVSVSMSLMYLLGRRQKECPTAVIWHLMEVPVYGIMLGSTCFIHY